MMRQHQYRSDSAFCPLSDESVAAIHEATDRFLLTTRPHRHPVERIDGAVIAAELIALQENMSVTLRSELDSYIHTVLSARTVAEPNLRWCSDGFEIACDNGEVVTGVFMKDCCDREIIAWRAWAERGLPGEPVRDMLVEAVEARFGQASVGSAKLEFLSDNGGAYRAHETHALVRELGLEPIHTPVCSPQSNGIAESFVNTFKRDYVSLMDRSNAKVVLAQLPDAFMHFNEVHPHSSLKLKSSRMFRRELARRAQESGAN